MCHHHRTLLVVHVATRTGTMPDGTPWGYEPEGYDDFAIGTGTTLGRIFHALYLAHAAKEARLYITLPPDELSQLETDGFQDLVQRAKARLKLHDAALAQNFGFDIQFAAELLDSAYVDDWSDADTRGTPMTTAGEAMRATRYAEIYGYGIIQPVSTGWGHSPRCGATDFAQAEKDGLVVAGYASVPFPGLEGQQAAIIDPPHLPNAPFAQMKPEHQLHKLMPTLFMTARGNAPMYTSFTQMVAGWYIANDRTTNAMGEKL